MTRFSVPASTCMVNYTLLFLKVYKRAHEPLTGNEQLRLTQEYIERQTDPRRRALVGLDS